MPGPYTGPVTATFTLGAATTEITLTGLAGGISGTSGSGLGPTGGVGGTGADYINGKWACGGGMFVNGARIQVNAGGSNTASTVLFLSGAVNILDCLWNSNSTALSGFISSTRFSGGAGGAGGRAGGGGGGAGGRTGAGQAGGTGGGTVGGAGGPAGSGGIGGAGGAGGNVNSPGNPGNVFGGGGGGAYGGFSKGAGAVGQVRVNLKQPSGKFFRAYPQMDGVGVGGPFFSNPLAELWLPKNSPFKRKQKKFRRKKVFCPGIKAGVF